MVNLESFMMKFISGELATIKNSCPVVSWRGKTCVVDSVDKKMGGNVYNVILAVDKNGKPIVRAIHKCYLERNLEKPIWSVS